MSKWNHEVNLVTEWKAFDHEAFDASLQKLVGKLEEHALYSNGSGYEHWVDELATSENIPDFDHKWHNFYNYCDAHGIWVKTTSFI